MMTTYILEHHAEILYLQYPQYIHSVEIGQNLIKLTQKEENLSIHDATIYILKLLKQAQSDIMTEPLSTETEQDLIWTEQDQKQFQEEIEGKH